MQYLVDMVRPGYFSKAVAADNRRLEFDYQNEQIIFNRIPVDFVFFGDSIIQLWELNAYFGGRGLIVLNRGIGGDITEYARKRFEADVIQLKPKAVICLIGINDSGLLADPDQNVSGQPIETVVQNIARNITEMIEISQSNKITSIICSILPTNMTNVFSSVKINDMAYCANKEIAVAAKERHAVYVDYYSSFVLNNSKMLKDGYSYDGLHPNTLGYNLMAEILRATLATSNITI